jgi:hypothetical protein
LEIVGKRLRFQTISARQWLSEAPAAEFNTSIFSENFTKIHLDGKTYFNFSTQVFYNYPMNWKEVKYYSDKYRTNKSKK